MKWTYRKNIYRQRTFLGCPRFVILTALLVNFNVYAAQDSVQSSIIYNQSKAIIGCGAVSSFAAGRQYSVGASTSLNTGNCQNGPSNASFTTKDLTTNITTNNSIIITCPGTYSLNFNDFAWWCNQYEWESATMYVYVNGSQIGSWPLSIPTSMGGAGTNCMSNNSRVQVAPAPAYPGNGPATISSFTITAAQTPATLSFSVTNGGTSAGSCGAGGGSSNGAGMGWQIGTRSNKSNPATFTITRTGNAY